VHVLRWCFPHRLSPACAVPQIISGFSRVSAIVRFPPTLSPTRFPHPLWRRMLSLLPLLIGISDFTTTARTGIQVSHLDSDSRVLPCGGSFSASCLYPPSGVLLAALAEPSLPPFLLLLLLLSEVSSCLLVRCASCTSLHSFPSSAGVRSSSHIRAYALVLRLGQPLTQPLVFR